MRFLILLSTFFMLFNSSVAQQIAVFDHINDTIYVGTNYRPYVRAIGEFYFATDIAGIDPAAISNISRWAALGTGIDGLADSSKGYAKSLLTKFFSGILKSDPKFFDDSIMENKANVMLGHLCFLGLDRGRLRLVLVTVYMNKGIRHPIVISFSKEDTPTAIVGATGMRPTNRAYGNAGLSRVAWLKKRMALWTGKDPDGSQAGRPVDVLLLTKNGGVWTRQ
jgi:hypothetical protein